MVFDGDDLIVSAVDRGGVHAMSVGFEVADSVFCFVSVVEGLGGVFGVWVTYPLSGWRRRHASRCGWGSFTESV